MAQPFVGEIRLFAGNFAPSGWMFCEGQTLPISENETLFQLLGTIHGGDGESTFRLPDLRGRIPVHAGAGPSGTTFQVGESMGTEVETLTVQQMPQHTHAMAASDAPGSLLAPTGAVPARATGSQPGLVMYGTDSSAPMNAGAVSTRGGSQPHENCQPFLCLNHIISLFGIYPSPV